MYCKKIKILFILPSLRSGGAERVVSFIAQNINKETFDPLLLILTSKTNKDFDVKNIEVEYLNKKRTLTAIPAIINKIINQKPDIVFTSIGQLNLLSGMLTKIFPNVKFIAREASIITVINRHRNRKVNFLTRVSMFFYNKLDKIICQSNDMAGDLMSSFKIAKDKIVIIGNPITVNLNSAFHTNQKFTKQLVTVGRLSQEKGIERILYVLARVDFDFKYTLIGDGPDKEKILNLIHELALEKKVINIPYTNDVLTFLKQSDLFLQGSFVEGFPNALLESCAVGCPVLAFDSPGGHHEIIISGVNGFIAADSLAFETQLSNALFIHKWNTEAIKCSVRRFNPDIILSKYEDVFKQIYYTKRGNFKR